MPGAKGGAHTGRNPTDRGKKGCKRHALTDAEGVPVVVQVGPANQRDDGKLEDLIEAFPVLTDGKTGEVHLQPRELMGDRGYGAWRFDAAHNSLHDRLATVLASLEPTAQVTRVHGAGAVLGGADSIAHDPDADGRVRQGATAVHSDAPGEHAAYEAGRS